MSIQELNRVLYCTADSVEIIRTIFTQIAVGEFIIKTQKFLWKKPIMLGIIYITAGDSFMLSYQVTNFRVSL